MRYSTAFEIGTSRNGFRLGWLFWFNVFCIFKLGDYKPSDVQVKINNNQLIFKEKSAGETLIKVITLPEFVEPRTVELYLNDGSLYIEAPVMLDRLRVNYLNINNISNSENINANVNTNRTVSTIENSSRDDFYNMASALLKGFESKQAVDDAPTSFSLTETITNQNNSPAAEITYKFNVKAESSQDSESCLVRKKPCPPPCPPPPSCVPVVPVCTCPKPICQAPILCLPGNLIEFEVQLH